MSNYVVSARKYRPQNFEEVVGQEAIATTLEHAIASEHLPQALLFCGPRGVGKTTCARILARRINEENADENTEDNDFAFNIFELDAASNNSVDDIRGLVDQVRFPPQTGKYKVYIIDEVHMLSNAAFNAFLKTLEEPPAHAIFILATTEKHKIIPTILSRCQIFDFKRIQISDIKNHLQKIAEKEGVTYEDDALHLIAQKADGALRDALSIFDRLVTFGQGNLTLKGVAETLNVLDYDFYFQVTDACLGNQIPEALNLLDDILKKGFDAQMFVSGLGGHFRDLLVAQNPQTINLLDVGENTKNKYLKQAQKCTPKFLIDAIEICNQADINYRASKNQRLTVEIALMQLCSLTTPDGELKKKSLKS
ncbi:DNA polymerase III subunit gamma/tau [Ornithobacterium rhinotracheale]|uniref:DNA polymerase III subunit gamma/tau n=1 Tax=Ornithobacterium rhinotracheale TaxID=28251 RepID=UPI00129CC550|nr:DNA polymerase III subunit gamma/tau [Ornithobacterium rhinotracheale]MRJ11024.1 DNA polymerase III subunit gamma/tau [Ornithobacterium rhinotracheale]